jgi:hypothetical protein
MGGVGRSRSGAVFVGFGAIGIIGLLFLCSVWECCFGRSASCFVVGRETGLPGVL